MISTQKTVKPTILTIFGISGNLSRIKLLPALYQLEATNQLPVDFYIVGITRRHLDVSQLASDLTAELKTSGISADKAVVKKLFTRFYIGNFEITKDADYIGLREYLNNIENEKGMCFNRLFYLAIPPALFSDIVKKIGFGGLHKGCQHKTHESRLLIEKPFGFDLSSARELISVIGKFFKESQVYRIDHYLAKETVMNILRFRHEHPEIESLWNKNYVSHVQITAAEDIGIGSRADFFEQTGALRDMVQSHLLQILALVAMDLPNKSDSRTIHQKRLEVLTNLKAIKPNEVNEHVVRGQFTEGKIKQQSVAGYRQEINSPSTKTETFVALQLYINQPIWQKVPFYIRAGKRLPEKLTDITLVFKGSNDNSETNTLSIRIHPTQGIAVNVATTSPAKRKIRIQECYNLDSNKLKLDAHARLLLNAAQGDQTLFPSSEEVLASWSFIQPVLNEWGKNYRSLEFYSAGSWGPAGSSRLLVPEHHEWLASKINVCPV